jgi:UDP-N-acetylmuramyl pentapeptide phosphotransferase/UDP-N-acetylglucosamine-1-phosphate transferase
MATENLLKYLIIPALAFAVTYGLTPQVMRLAARLGMVDQPGQRRIHKRPVPLAGGLAVFAGFHCACAAIFLLPWAPFSSLLTQAGWLNMLLLTSVLLLIGLWDDRFGMPAAIKLAGQAAVGSLAYMLDMHLGGFFGIALPVWIDLPATVFWFVAFINAFNLIDGMDGLATGLAAIAAFGLAGVFLIGSQPGDCLVMLALLGACLAFLRFNFNPARIFLGDTGSMFLGCALAALALNTSTKSTTLMAIVVPLMAVGIPMFDTFLAFWRRLARKFLDRGGSAVFAADSDHLHHRLLKKGLSQPRVAALLYAGSFALVSVALLAMLFTSSALGIYMIAFVVGVYISIRHIATVEMWTTGMALMQGLKRPRLKNLTVPLYIASDLLVLLAANLAANLLQDPEQASWRAVRTALLEQAPLQVGIPFLCLAWGGRVYKRVWHLAGSMDFAALGAWTVMGILLSAGVSLVFGSEYSAGSWLRATVFYIGLALAPLLCLHAVMRFTADALAAIRLQGESADTRMPVLIYGVSHQGKLFLRDQKAHCLKSGAMLRIMGFLDHDANLHGRLIHGLRVFGGMKQLEAAIKKTSCRLLVVTAELSAEAREELRAIADRTCIAVSEWRPMFRDMGQHSSETDQHIDAVRLWRSHHAFQRQLASQSGLRGAPGAATAEEALAAAHAGGVQVDCEHF